MDQRNCSTEKNEGSILSLDWTTINFLHDDLAAFLKQECTRRDGIVPYEYGYVYLIWAKGTNIFKIGKSINPDRRVTQISPVMPYPLEVVLKWRTPFMSLSERWLHLIFQESRMQGEWFRLEHGELQLIQSQQIKNDMIGAYGLTLLVDYMNAHPEKSDELDISKLWSDKKTHYLTSWIESIFSDIMSFESHSFESVFHDISEEKASREALNG